MADLQERMASFRTGARPSSNAPFNTNAYGRPHSAAPGGSNTAVGAEEARRKEQLERLRKLNDMASKAKSDAAKAADDTAKHMRDAEARAETVRKQWEAHRAGVAGGARPGTAPSGGAGPASYDGSKFQSAGRSGYEPTGQQQQRQNWEEAFKQRQAQYGCVYMPCPPRSRPDYNPRSAAPRQTESTAIHFRIVSKLAVRLYMYRRRSEIGSRRFHSASAANRGYSTAGFNAGAVTSLEVMETRWKALEASADTIRYDSIPWPPRGSSNVLSWATTSVRAADTAFRKKAYRQLVLRWHPDKFEVRFHSAPGFTAPGTQSRHAGCGVRRLSGAMGWRRQAKFGSKVDARDKDRIMQMVQSISQGVNQEYESFKAKGLI